MEGYRRPPIERGGFRDDDGDVIPYGARWTATPADRLPYGVTRHPERFAPLLEVARALDAAMPAANRPGGSEIAVRIETTDFPGAIIRVEGHDFPFPACGCDACDEDVEELAEQMEQLVDAVVAGRWRNDRDGYRFWGEWGSRGGWRNPQGRA